MLLNPNLLLKIEGILEKYLDSAIVFTCGKDAVSKVRLKQLVDLGLVNANADSVIDRAYWISKFKQAGISREEAEEAAGNIQKILHSKLTPFEIEGLELSRQTALRELVKHRENVKGTVSDMCLSGNYTYRTATATPHSVLEEGLIKRETIGKLTKQLRDKTQDLNRDWKRVVVTEMTNTINSSSVDKITSENKGKKSEEIYVYKAIPVDDHTCNVCLKVYLEPDEKTPKVYRLSELQSNGSNRGKKSNEWVAVIGATHPNCRGQLVELANGWGFEVGTDILKYYHKDYLWYRDKPNIIQDDNKNIKNGAD